MKKPAQNDPHLIAPDAYPQMMGEQDTAHVLLTLRSAQTAVKAQVAMEAAIPPMRAAILRYVNEMEDAAGDLPTMFEKIHEIRGFAETAGLATAGRIAEILYRYRDDMERIGRPLDMTIVALHVAAIARAARAEEEDAGMGEAVAAELAALVARRLAGCEQG
jgi:hypothetical protein